MDYDKKQSKWLEQGSSREKGRMAMTTIDLFTTAEIEKAKGKTHAEIMEILRPAMDRINKRTGQENDLGYMAYRLEYLLNIWGENK